MAEYLNWAQTEENRKAFNKGIIETLVIKAKLNWNKICFTSYY
jgi:hypothetical protein